MRDRVRSCSERQRAFREMKSHRNFFVTAIFICYCRSKVPSFELEHAQHVSFSYGRLHATSPWGVRLQAYSRVNLSPYGGGICQFPGVFLGPS
jgi:hypothetical protein